eukprot:3673459-Amphidinium_carterae.1
MCFGKYFDQNKKLHVTVGVGTVNKYAQPFIEHFLSLLVCSYFGRIGVGFGLLKVSRESSPPHKQHKSNVGEAWRQCCRTSSGKGLAHIC